VPKTAGFVTNRKKPICVSRQKMHTSVDRPSNQVFAAEWWTCESNVNASQTLTSGSSIFFVQDLGDSLTSQVYGVRLTCANQRDFDAFLLLNWLARAGRWIGDDHGGSLGQSRPAFEDNDTVVNATGNIHAGIVVRVRGPVNRLRIQDARVIG
jgi:hypothetical protein